MSTEDAHIYKACVRRDAMAKIKNTVGYNEAVDKAAFVTAAEIAIDHTFGIMKRTIDNLEAMNRSTTAVYREVVSDMRTVTRIILKYKED
jgi:hypothetical protein